MMLFTVTSCYLQAGLSILHEMLLGFCRDSWHEIFQHFKKIVYPLKMLLGRRRCKYLYWYCNTTLFSHLIIVTYLKQNLLCIRKHHMYSGNSIASYVTVTKCFLKVVTLLILFCYSQTFQHASDFELTLFR